jgi:ribosomal protein L11 methyltransferase
MTNFKVFQISSEPFNVDLISGALWDLDILGINEDNNSVSVFVSEDSNISIHDIEKILSNIRTSNLIESYSISEDFLENRNWNEEWAKNTKIIEVEDKFVIKPSFKDYDSDDKRITLIIDPKMSFGTGEHETTRIVLKLLSENIIPDMKVLDVGTGTGILGIAAAKLGASEIVAVDNDEWCSINASENILLNQINNMKVILGPVDELDDNNFDLMLANINYDVLIELRDRLFNLNKSNGKLIISGILDSDREKIERQFSLSGYTALKCEQFGEWLGIVFKKN